MKEAEELERLRAYFKHWDQLMDYVGGSGNYTQPFTEAGIGARFPP